MQRLDSAIGNEISHIQIHHSEFMANDEPKYTIDNVNDVIAAIEKMDGVKAVSKRIKMQALAEKSGRQAGVFVYGIEPEREKLVTGIHLKLIDTTGTYLESKRSKPVLIGEKLARILAFVTYTVDSSGIEFLKNIKLDENVIRVLDTIQQKEFRTEAKLKNALTDRLGEETYEKNEYRIRQAFANYKTRKKIGFKLQGNNNQNIEIAGRISGIYKTNNSAFDQMTVFVKYDDLISETGFNSDQAHEIAILADDQDVVPGIVKKIKEKFPGLDIRTWREIQPALALTTDYLGLYFYITIAFILFALGFGIINTMLMAILERVKELGMLMAIGMNKWKIFSMIMLETIFLSLVGGITGMILGAVCIEITNNTGIDLTMMAEGLEAFGYDAIIYPEISAHYYFGTTILIILTGIIAALYPARKALKLNPSEALRMDN